MVLNVSRSNMFIKSVAEMKRLICISGNTKKDRIKNIYINKNSFKDKGGAYWCKEEEELFEMVW